MTNIIINFSLDKILKFITFINALNEFKYSLKKTKYFVLANFKKPNAKNVKLEK